MRTTLAIVALLAGGLCATDGRAATYFYTGTPFTQADAPYQIGQRVTGSVELVQALPPNRAATDVPIANFVDLRFVDGQQVRTRANTTICRLVLGTDAQGHINAWIIWMRANTVGAGNSRASLETFSMPDLTGDLAGVGVFPGACDTGALDPRATTMDAGSWRVDDVFGDGFEAQPATAAPDPAGP